MTINQEAFFKLTKARIALITEQPFWGALALRLRLVEEPSIKTLAVDGEHIFYNPEFINSLSGELCKSAVAHEVGHCVYEHIARRGDRDPKKWNYAGDYVINQVLSDCGFEIGQGWLLNPQYKDMTSDHIYSMLPDLPPDGGGPGQPGGPLCDIMDANKEVNAASVDEWKIATVMAAQTAKQAGKLPGTLERFIHDMINPKADWRSVLRRFIVEVSKNDYSWQRPKKMMVPFGYYLPTLFSESMGELITIVDTSGSIDDHQLQVFGSEIIAARASVRPRMTRNIYCDTRVNHIDEFEQNDECTFKMHGGGGTDFRPPFERIEQEGWKPAAVLYFTDGYGTFPDVAPDYPVLWCMTTPVQPPWGEVVEVDVS